MSPEDLAKKAEVLSRKLYAMAKGCESGSDPIPGMTEVVLNELCNHVLPSNTDNTDEN